MRPRPLILGVAALLAACEVGPDYRLPAILTGRAPPPKLVSVAEPAYDALAPLPPNWWRLYDDPVLDRLVEKALRRNSDVRQALATLEKMQATLREAEAKEEPQTSISAATSLAGAQANLGGMRVTGSPALNYDLKGGASYMLDLFGKLSRADEESRADVGASQASLDQVRVSTAASTASAYASACVAGLNILVTNRSIDVARRMLDVTERRFKAGLSSENDVVQSRSTLRQTEAMLPTYFAQQGKALFMLAVLTGDPPSDYPAAIAACTQPPLLRRKIPVGDGAGLIARRPDIRSAERKLAAAVADIGVNTADLYPSVTLTGSVSDMKSNSFGLTTKIFSYSIGPMLSWNFPNISVARAKIAESNAAARSAMASFDGSVLGALRDTETALLTLARDLDTERLQAAATDDATAAYGNSVRLYSAGIDSFNSLLGAENTMIKAQASLAKATAQVSTDQITLFMQLGGGWQDAPAPAATPLEDVAAPGDHFRLPGSMLRLYRSVRGDRGEAEGAALLSAGPSQ